MFDDNGDGNLDQTEYERVGILYWTESSVVNIVHLLDEDKYKGALHVAAKLTSFTSLHMYIKYHLMNCSSS